MPNAEGERIENLDTSRDYTRILLVLALIAAIVLLGALLPFALSTGSIGGTGQGTGGGDGGGGGAGAGGAAEAGSQSPLATQIPVPNEGALPQTGANGTGSNGTTGANTSQSSLGALNPASKTSVGGSIETNPYRSNDTEVHFLVTSSTSSYWRTGAYASYTGSGWAREENTTEYEEPIRSEGAVGQTAEYRVQLRSSATALPTIWRPTSIETEAALEVSSEGGVRASRALDSGTTYTGVSQIPPRDIGVLRAAGSDYPEPIAAEYTRLPNQTNKRVEPFTTNLTSDASTPYETAVEIERWLESTKNYSLTVSEPPSDDVASQFIFEMDEGYCEYFATAMTVMLRSQGVPARYVVGYSTGQPIAENTYLVRNMNAHAWVEVYFPDIGWVRFDPTPGNSRLQAEQAAMNETAMGGDSYNHTEEGSPGEVCSCAGQSESPNQPANETAELNESDPPETNQTQTKNETQSKESPSPDSLSFELNRTPVPGATVNVTVTRGNETVPRVNVYFNDERVGTTNENGALIAQIPYTQELTISISEAPSEDTNSQSFSEDGIQMGAPPPTDRAAFALIDNRALAQTTTNTTNRSYSLPDEASVTLEGQIVPNGTAALTASVEDVPVRKATVYLDETSIGTTDQNGRLLFDLPTRPGNYTLHIQRGPVRGNTTFSIDSLNLSAEPSLPLALPGTGITITATRGEEPAAGVPIKIAGRQVGGTDENGTLTAALPLQDSAKITGTQYGQTRRETLTGLYGNAALVFGSGIGLLLVGVGIAYWRGYRLRHLLAILGRLFAWITSGAVWILVAVSTFLERLPRQARQLISTMAAHFRDLSEGRASLTSLLSKLQTWLQILIVEGWANITKGLDEAVDTSEHFEAGETSQPESARSVRDAWERFLSVLTIDHPARQTPGDLARYAIQEDGLPAEAVQTLRDVFREVEYGNRSPGDRLTRVEAALDEIEQSISTEDDHAD